jgi:hypothetical protein
LLVNLNFYLLNEETAERYYAVGYGSRYEATGRGSSSARVPPSIEATIQRLEELENLEHLVVVAGHAIWTG